MKLFTVPEIAAHRQTSLELKTAGSTGHPLYGIFEIPSTLDRRPMRVVASAVNEWDHVSVSRRDRVPNWYEMCQIKDLFFEPEEMAMQLHPPRSEWVNNARHCLHLFRPHAPLTIPAPPPILVGIAGLDPEKLAGMRPEQVEAARVKAIAESKNASR